MTPEDPTTQPPNAEEFEQKKLIATIREKISSKSMEDKFSAIELIPKITDPDERMTFEEIAFDLIRTILHAIDLDNEADMNHVLEAMRCIDCLSENYRHRALVIASRAYNALKAYQLDNLDDPVLKKFFEEVDKN